VDEYLISLVTQSGGGISKKKRVFEGACPAGVLSYCPNNYRWSSTDERLRGHTDVEIPGADSCRSPYHDRFNSKAIHLSGSPFLRRITFPVPDLAFDFSFLARDFS
ncbi:hypothetical protein ACFLZE_05310, partial [Thermodesulfobacteriota bacterium]